MNIVLLFDKIKNKIAYKYRNYVFFKKTGYHATLVGHITLINTNLKLGKNVTIYPDVMFYGDGLIEIGDNVNIGNGTIIYSSKSGGVKIGNDTMIAAQCYIIDMDHGINSGNLIRTQQNTVSPVTIGNDVWIAANCTILKGSNIGNGAIVGAKSMVKGLVNENSISVGIPAHHLKYRGE